ncbi:ATP-binding protein [Kitasatospora sp. NPDC056076]|uniref:ATP-binding protein n=1 Tax=Kitasatospora sp. NPDC056076 TaxID=3345703 RepID=UPI0035D953E3
MNTTLERPREAEGAPSATRPAPATMRLPYAFRSARAARLMVNAKLIEWGLEALIDDAELIISELVSNAAKTGCRTYMIVAVRRPTAGVVRLLVSDGSASPPVRIEAGPSHESGRGLALVHHLTKAKWGVRLWPHGKVIHADLGVPPSELA